MTAVEDDIPRPDDDSARIIACVEAMWAFAPEGSSVQLFSLNASKGDPKFVWGEPTNVPALIQRASHWWPEGRHIYVVPAAMPLPENGRGRSDAAYGRSTLVADLDLAGGYHSDKTDDGKPLWPSLDVAVAFLQQLDYPPSVILATGGGAQAWWYLSDWVPSLPKGEAGLDAVELSRRLELYLRESCGHSIDSIYDLVRPVRFPATFNPTAGKQGYIVEADLSRRYDLEDLDAALPEWKRPTEVQRQAATLRANGASLEDLAEMRPGDDYALKTPCEEVLARNNWTNLPPDRLDNVYTVREGKDPADGHSAIIRVDNTVHNWSTGSKLPKGGPYSSFQLLVWLEYGATEATFSECASKAASDLRKQGFGGQAASAALQAEFLRTGSTTGLVAVPSPTPTPPPTPPTAPPLGEEEAPPAADEPQGEEDEPADPGPEEWAAGSLDPTAFLEELGFRSKGKEGAGIAYAHPLVDQVGGSVCWVYEDGTTNLLPVADKVFPHLGADRSVNWRGLLLAFFGPDAPKIWGYIVNPAVEVAGLLANLRDAVLGVEGVGETGGGSWGAIDLGPYVDGTHVPEPPAILERADGRCLFYTDAVNGIFGESSGGKSWIILFAVVQLLRRGEHVTYLDFEDSPGRIVQRLFALGATPDQILECFHYHGRIQDKGGPQQVAVIDREIIQHEVRFVVIDTVGESAALQGVKHTEDDTGFSDWMREFPRHWASVGPRPAVVTVDHTNRADPQALMAGGVQRKRAGIDGAYYRVDAKVAFSREKAGVAMVVCTKDKAGDYAVGQAVIDVRFIPGDEGALTIEARVPEGRGDGDGAGFRPTGLMERASRWLEDRRLPATKTEITETVTGNKQALGTAVEVLVTEGYFERLEDKRLRSVRPFRDMPSSTPHGASTVGAEGPRLRDFHETERD